jgi:hypothetical protein
MMANILGWTVGLPVGKGGGGWGGGGSLGFEHRLRNVPQEHSNVIFSILKSSFSNNVRKLAVISAG